MEPTKSITFEIPNLETVTRKRVYPTSLFAVALLFFFFNFCEMSCQGRRFAAVTGIEMITGTQVEAPQQKSMFSFEAPSEEDGKKLPGSLWAGLAFAAAAFGLAVFLLKKSKENLVGIIAGGIGAVSLILLQITLNSQIRAEGGGMIQLNFLMPYWISLLSLSGAGVLCWMRNQQSEAPIPVNLESLKELIKSDGNSPSPQTQSPEPPSTVQYQPPTARYEAPVPQPTVVTNTPVVTPPVAQPEMPVAVVTEPETTVETLVSQAILEPIVEPVAPPVPPARPLSSAAPSYQHHYEMPQQAYANASRANANNWLVWVIGAAVGLVVVVTILVEVL